MKKAEIRKERAKRERSVGVFLNSCKLAKIAPSMSQKMAAVRNPRKGFADQMAEARRKSGNSRGRKKELGRWALR